MTKSQARSWILGNCRLAELESGFANVYDESGAAVIVAEEVVPGDLSRLLSVAWYEHGLESPDYSVFQSRDEAMRDAGSRRPNHQGRGN